MSKDIHKFPSELAERFQVRMPDGLRDKLKQAATSNNRSMNSEIVARLEGSFGSVGTPPETYEAALAAHGGDTSSLLAAETIRLRLILERLETGGLTILPDGDKN